MPDASFRDPLLASLAPRLAALAPRASAVAAGLTPAQLATAPPQGGWSIAQVFTHLVLGNSAYFGPVAERIAATRGRGPRPHRRSFFGGLMIAAMSESSSLKAPTVASMEPNTLPADPLGEFLANLERAAALVREADGADLRTRLWSPVAPIPLNLGDAFTLLVVHAERHLAQAERTRRAIGA